MNKTQHGLKSWNSLFSKLIDLINSQQPWGAWGDSSIYITVEKLDLIFSQAILKTLAAKMVLILGQTILKTSAVIYFTFTANCLRSTQIHSW